MSARKFGKAGIQPDYFFIIIYYCMKDRDAGASVVLLWLCLFDGLAGLIIGLDRPRDVIGILEPFGFWPIGPPFGRAGWFFCAFRRNC